MAARTSPAKGHAEPPAKPEIECAAPGCDVRFMPKRSTAKYHSATCRQRAGRDRKAAVAHAKAEAQNDTLAEHGLVKAVRTELEGANVLTTFSGQLALQLARRVANPDEPALMALSKELRAVMADALTHQPKPDGGADADSDGAAPEEDDEVTRARRLREDARQKAGLA